MSPSIIRPRSGAPLDDCHVSQLQDSIEIDLDMGAPIFTASPDDRRIVGTRDAVEDAGNVPATERIVRIHVDQRVHIIRNALVWYIAWLVNN